MYTVSINGCYVFVAFSGIGGTACAIQVNRAELNPSPHEICEI